jgi:hypothetical protein
MDEHINLPFITVLHGDEDPNESSLQNNQYQKYAQLYWCEYQPRANPYG